MEKIFYILNKIIFLSLLACGGGAHLSQHHEITADDGQQEGLGQGTHSDSSGTSSTTTEESEDTSKNDQDTESTASSADSDNMPIKKLGNEPSFTLHQARKKKGGDEATSEVNTIQEAIKHFQTHLLKNTKPLPYEVRLTPLFHSTTAGEVFDLKKPILKLEIRDKKGNPLPLNEGLQQHYTILLQTYKLKGPTDSSDQPSEESPDMPAEQLLMTYPLWNLGPKPYQKNYTCMEFGYPTDHSPSKRVKVALKMRSNVHSVKAFKVHRNELALARLVVESIQNPNDDRFGIDINISNGDEHLNSLFKEDQGS